MDMDITKRSAFRIIMLAGFILVQNVDSLKTQAQIMADILRMADAIMAECKNETLIGRCNYYKTQMRVSITVRTMCRFMDSYLYCQNQNCIPKSLTLTQVLGDAMNIPYCTEMALFPQDTVAWSIADRIFQMTNMCSFSSDLSCDLYQSYFVWSRNLQDVCKREYQLASCLEQNCLNIPLDLEQKIAYAKNDPACYRFTTTPRPSVRMTSSTRATTTRTTTRDKTTTQRTTSTTTQVVSETDILETIQEVANGLMLQCTNELFENGCSSSRVKVDEAKTLREACLAMYTYVLCMDRNCRMSFPRQGVSSDALVVARCGPGLNTDSNVDIRNIIYRVVDMVALCTLRPGYNCDREQKSLLTSDSTHEVCLSEKDYVDCLQYKCTSPSDNLQHKISTAMSDPLCVPSGCSLLRTSGLLAILAAGVMSYL